MLKKSLAAKNRYVKLFALIVFVSLFACAARIYGVPEEQWKQMNDAQRQAAIEEYNERERLREIERQRQAQIEAAEAERRAEEERRMQAEQREQIAAIYRGEAGQYGDLLRVTIQGGEIRIAGRHSAFQPVSFKIASGEIKKVDIISEGRAFTEREELLVGYKEGILLVDGNNREATRIVYDQGWKVGKKYRVNTSGWRELHNVNIDIEIIPHVKRSGVQTEEIHGYRR